MKKIKQGDLIEIRTLERASPETRVMGKALPAEGAADAAIGTHSAEWPGRGQRRCSTASTGQSGRQREPGRGRVGPGALGSAFSVGSRPLACVHAGGDMSQFSVLRARSSGRRVGETRRRTCRGGSAGASCSLGDGPTRLSADTEKNRSSCLWNKIKHGCLGRSGDVSGRNSK